MLYKVSTSRSARRTGNHRVRESPMLFPATGVQRQVSIIKVNPGELSNRDKQLLCGLFLSKYDQAALHLLGFKSFTEAFNILGYALGARPASIKNYRDELDPYLSTKRRGWHKRPLRSHCKRILDEFADTDVVELGLFIKRFLCPSYALQAEPDVRRVLARCEGANSSFAKRLMTGRAAEEYFVCHHESIPEFTGSSVTDTTQWGCGFDFKLVFEQSDLFSVVEVKGMRSRIGQILFTDLEHAMAETLAERYFLVVVRNFADKPFHSVFRNPLRCNLPFVRIERKETRISWLTNLTS